MIYKIAGGMLLCILLLLSACAPIITETTSLATTGPAPSSIGSPMAQIDVEDSLVQVWSGEELLATGVTVGNEGDILIVLNWEVTTWESVNITAAQGETYLASVRNVDPRTGATSLHVPGLDLPLLETAEAETGANVTAWWYRPTLIDDLLVNGQGEPELEKTWLTVGGTGSPVQFTGLVPPESMFDRPMPCMGAVITDETGAVLGLLGPDYMELFPHPHPFGAIPTAAAIGPAFELLSPGYPERSYAAGPLMVVITNEQATAMRYGLLENYDGVVKDLQAVFRQAGTPLTADELPERYYDIRKDASDGNTATFAFSRPVELYGPGGTLCGSGKWVCIQWGRTGGAPDVIYYGDGRLELKGGFELAGDISGFLDVIDPLAYHHP